MSRLTSKVRYSLKVILGLSFLCFAVWLSYWLIFDYGVRNLLGLIAIGIFLIIPSVLSALTIPREILALIVVWRSNDPERGSKAMEHIREQDPM